MLDNSKCDKNISYLNSWLLSLCRRKSSYLSMSYLMLLNQEWVSLWAKFNTTCFCVINRVVNNTCKKYWQYQYYYFGQKLLPIPIPILLQKSIGNTNTSTYTGNTISTHSAITDAFKKGSSWLRFFFLRRCGSQLQQCVKILHATYFPPSS